MNRREMLTAGFRQIARTLPGLAKANRSLAPWLNAAAPAPPPPEALSFPPQVREPAPDGQKPFKED